MASDIVGTDGLAAGDQRLGDAVVNLQGRNGQVNEGHQVQGDRGFVVEIVDIHDKYDNRFDNPRYYSGDTPS